MLSLKPILCLVLFVCTMLAPSSKSFGSTSAFIFQQNSLPPVKPLSQKDKFRLEMMKQYAGLSIADYEKLKGKKLGFLVRAYFKMNQHRAQKFIHHYDGDGPNVLSKISWFFKGVLLGPIAVLLAYILFKDEERELIKWTWFGFATWPVFLAVYFIFYANK